MAKERDHRQDRLFDKTAATCSGSTRTADKDGALTLGRLLVAGSTASRLSQLDGGA